MAYSPELFIISQQYFIVLERFCGEKVTGGSSEVQKFRSSEVEKLKVKDSNSEEIVSPVPPSPPSLLRKRRIVPQRAASFGKRRVAHPSKTEG
jgi:hypothetical protein